MGCRRIDSHGAVHATIVFRGDDATHNGLFPNAPKYKTWRWSKGNGVDQSMLCNTAPDAEDYAAIHNWLYRNGCLNKWEL